MSENSTRRFIVRHQHILAWLMGTAMFWAMMYLHIHQHETGFLTNDSLFYFEISDNMLAGKAWVLKSMRNDFNQPFSPFPPLYSMVISFLRLFSLSAIASSKLLNALLASGILWAFCFRYKHMALMALWPLFTDHFIFVFCHSWSEPLFTALLLGFAWHLEKNNTSNLIVALATLAFLVALCFTRYIGAFAIAFGFLLGFNQLLKKNLQAAIPILLVCAAAMFCFVAYLIADYLQSGMWTGGPRYPHGESFSQLAINWLQAMVNEALIFRNLFPNFNSPIAWAGLAIQLLIMVMLFRKLQSIFRFKLNLFLAIGLVYLATITLIRGYIYFAEPFDTRLLFPGTAMLFWGLNEHFYTCFHVQKMRNTIEYTHS